MSRVYLAGPMTGYPDFNRPAFHEAAIALRDAGHEVCDPTDNGADGTETWAHYMRADLADLLTCEAVVTLPGWQKSRGASLEVYIACQLAMPVLDVEQVLCGEAVSR